MKEMVQAVTPDFSYIKRQRQKPPFPLLTVWMLSDIEKDYESFRKLHCDSRH